MNSQNDSDKIKNILDELSKVLDELTKKEKQNIETIVTESPQRMKSVEEIVKESETEISKTVQQQEEVKPLEIEETIQQVTSESQRQVIEEVTTQISQPATPQSEVKPKEVEKQAGVVLTAIVFYPAVESETKDVFINSLNSTLERVSKSKVNIVVNQVFAYSSLREEIIENPLLELQTVKIIFLIVNELTTEVEDAVKKLSSFAEIVKTITYRDVKLRSTYLDLAIDLLLATK